LVLARGTVQQENTPADKGATRRDSGDTNGDIVLRYLLWLAVISAQSLAEKRSVEKFPTAIGN
jgi:hypothetical protein